MLCTTCTTRPARCPITTDTDALRTCALVTSCREFAPDHFRFPVSARISKECPECEGAGHILTNWHTLYGWAEYDTCPTCNGLGTIPADTLPHVSRALANRDAARADLQAVGLYA